MSFSIPSLRAAMSWRMGHYVGSLSEFGDGFKISFMGLPKRPLGLKRVKGPDEGQCTFFPSFQPKVELSRHFLYAQRVRYMTLYILDQLRYYAQDFFSAQGKD